MIKQTSIILPVLFACSFTAIAQVPTDAISQGEAVDEIIVHGRSLDLIGEAKAASEGVVGYADFLASLIGVGAADFLVHLPSKKAPFAIMSWSWTRSACTFAVSARSTDTA